MRTAKPHNDADAVEKACRQVRQLLASFGIASVFCRVDGDTPGEDLSDAASSENICARWENCCQEALWPWRRSADGEKKWQTLCPAGFLITVVPVRRKRQTVGIFICCLKELRYQKTESFERICRKLGIDSAAFLELGLKDAVAGAALTDMLEPVLEILIEKTRLNLENHDELEALSNSLSQSYEELALLHRISDRMRITQPPQTFFSNLCRDLKEVVDAKKILVLWADQDRPAGAVQRVATPGPPELDQTEIELIWQRTKNQMNRSSGILIDSNVDGPYRHQWPRPIHSLAAVPIRRGEIFIGAVAALNKINKADFDSIDTKLLMSVANESAVYLDNFRLYKDLQELLIGALRALTSSIDAKDPYTCGHSERVALIARWLAERLSLSAVQVNNIYLAGLLHDVGKIGVSETVLCKPGKLTAHEFEQINRHPQIGANILGPIKQMDEVTPAVLSHHEHFDGSGYPRHLRGDNIPLSGRVIMLADSFDAMTSDRTYRKALPRNTALAEIRRFSGTQFDPALAELFLSGNVEKLVRQLDNVKNNQESSDRLYRQIMN